VTDALSIAIATTLQAARQARGMSGGTLADRSGVSRAMISKIERGETQPTAVLLAKLAAALGMTLSELVARAEQDQKRLARREDQPHWTDPDTGYTRRAVSPTAGGPLELIEIELPASAEAAFPAEAFALRHQQIWVLTGRLTFHEGDTEHVLDAGDCLQVGPPQACVFANRTGTACRYVVALAMR
jgi:transcriptional regulator with XRE-family HTH domain